MDHRVIIVGAGPGGMALALKLSHFGFRALIIEKTMERSAFTKALTMQPRTLEVVQDLGLLDSFIEQGNPILRNHLSLDGKRVGTFEYSRLPSQCNHLLSVTQPVSESILEGAVEKQGIEILRGVECIDYEHTQEGCRLKVRNANTYEERFLYGQYVISADGGKSLIRKLALERGEVNLTHEARYSSNFIMGDFKMEDFDFDRNERHTFFKDKTMCGLVPMVYPYVRIIAFGLKKAESESPVPEEFAQIMKQIANLDVDVSHGEWMSRFYPSRFMLSKFRTHNLFFIGDSAHIASPIGAQGINLSIEDGFNLGWKLGMVLSEKSAPSLLEEYSKERSCAADRILRETNNFHRKLSNPLLFFFFSQQLKTLKHASISEMVTLKETRFFIDYPADKQAKGRVSVGKRMFDEKLKDGSYFFSRFKTNEWTLVVNHLSKNAPNTDDDSADFGMHRVVIRNEFSPNSQLAKELKVAPFYILVSPDKYIKAVASNANLETLLNDQVKKSQLA